MSRIFDVKLDTRDGIVAWAKNLHPEEAEFHSREMTEELGRDADYLAACVRLRAIVEYALREMKGADK